MPTATDPFRSTPLVVCLSAAFAMGASVAAHAATLPPASMFGWAMPHAFTTHAGPRVIGSVVRNVASCLDDGGIGTLRQVVGASGSGDGVDMSGLPLSCSTITLTQGEIVVGVQSLVLVGPKTRTLSIQNSQIGRILHHTVAGGDLNIDYLTLSNAKVYTTSTPARGGCVFSAGSVGLNGSTISGCTAVSYSGTAAGGGIYAAGSIYVSASRITGNAAYTYDYSTAKGGGVYALNGLAVAFSTIGKNFCSNAGFLGARGGGAYARGSFGQTGDGVILAFSTIEENQAGTGGGIYFVGTSAGFNAQDSTISGNRAVLVGGVDLHSVSGTAHFQGVTIAFNSATQYGGIRAFMNIAAYSSIIAKNTNGNAFPFPDVYIHGAGNGLTGHNNLIVASNQVSGPTLTSDPELTPLANHGGQTRTHGLSLTSPAINTGSSVGGSIDQRGVGFLRQVPVGLQDMGAFERQAGDDELFYGGFD